ncbi:MAG TPA: ATP-dependent 6-phosphofructokinase [Acidobacteriota bacterium]|jgi:6-phosphofructokinase 1|nr:ATP-dependent 6-phosphofructokinase [Acidobacteriota bacterium]
MFDPSKVKKIAINTGGGDAPGLNAVIRAVTLAAINAGWEVFGVTHGYRSLIDGNVIPLTRDKVRGITHLGGTILGTANKGNPFEFPIQKDGQTEIVDISDRVVENFHRLGIDVLICIGGDGSMRIAKKFINKGIPIVGVPKTIDNDIPGTIITFGFDTAVSTATDAIDRLHSTAESHERVMVVEVMGRYAGWIALNSGMSGSADVILIPEIPFQIEKICEKIMKREKAGRHFSIVVCAEGAFPAGGEMKTKAPKEAGRDILLGGIAEYVAREINIHTGKETRSLVLGHLQRGGSPTTFDRLLGLRFGAAAIRCILEGKINVMVALDPPGIKTISIDEAISKMKCVPLDCDSMITARALGISFGD